MSIEKANLTNEIINGVRTKANEIMNVKGYTYEEAWNAAKMYLGVTDMKDLTSVKYGQPLYELKAAMEVYGESINGTPVDKVEPEKLEVAVVASNIGADTTTLNFDQTPKKMKNVAIKSSFEKSRTMEKNKVLVLKKKDNLVKAA